VSRQYGTLTSGGQEGRQNPDAVPVDLSYFYILEVETDAGIVGIGEISDIDPKMRLSDGSPMELEGLTAKLRAALLGKDPTNLERITREIDFGGLTDCAIDSACYDIIGKISGLSATALAGGRYRESVWVSWVAYIREPEAMAPEIEEKLEQGFTAFKFKVGRDIDLDEQRIKLFREIGGPDLNLKLDANAAWDVDEAVAFIRRLEKFDLAGVETPIDKTNVTGMAQVRKAVDTPILEHVSTPEYALELVRHEAADVFNVATVGCGGIYRAKKVIALAEATGLQVLLGSTVELGVGTAAQLALAASSARVDWPSDLIGPLMYTDDVLIEPWEWEDGCLRVPTGAGLGVTLDPEKLQSLHEPLPTR
jgi:muconate cycloisomerase